MEFDFEVFGAILEFDFEISGTTENSLLKENFRTDIIKNACFAPGRNGPAGILP